MSKFQINVKSSNYARDKETFLKDLKQFNESKGYVLIVFSLVEKVVFGYVYIVYKKSYLI